MRTNRRNSRLRSAARAGRRPRPTATRTKKCRRARRRSPSCRLVSSPTCLRRPPHRRLPCGKRAPLPGPKSTTATRPRLPPSCSGKFRIHCGSPSWPRLPHELRQLVLTPSSIYRKDLISAMKLPDSEPLSTDEYWVIVDQWKQEWERGVQVPVNPDSLPEPSVKQLSSPIAVTRHDFKL